jgi:hypothetical protein
MDEARKAAAPQRGTGRCGAENTCRETVRMGDFLRHLHPIGACSLRQTVIGSRTPEDRVVAFFSAARPIAIAAGSLLAMAVAMTALCAGVTNPRRPAGPRD